MVINVFVLLGILSDDSKGILTAINNAMVINKTVSKI